MKPISRANQLRNLLAIGDSLQETISVPSLEAISHARRRIVGIWTMAALRASEGGRKYSVSTAKELRGIDILVTITVTRVS